MPGMQRIDFGGQMYTRWCVPIDRQTTREYYFHAWRPKNEWERLRALATYPIVYRWWQYRQFGLQDDRVLSGDGLRPPRVLLGVRRRDHRLADAGDPVGDLRRPPRPHPRGGRRKLQPPRSGQPASQREGPVSQGSSRIPCSGDQLTDGVSKFLTK